MTVGPLSWLTIQQYCEVCKLKEDQTEAMHYLLKQLDQAYLKLQVKK